jgi:hypothetical protein
MLSTGCAVGGGGAGTTADREQVAAALSAAQGSGVNFTLAETIVITGGQVPQGKQLNAQLAGRGRARGGQVDMELVFKNQAGKVSRAFDVRVLETLLYVRPHDGDRGWRASQAAGATPIFAPVRLDLLREAVLLAKTMSGGSVTHVSGGFAHRYSATPAGEQLEQLEGFPLSGPGEAAFLKTASGQVRAFLEFSGTRLLRVEVQLDGTDPQTGERQRVNSGADFKPARVADVEPPSPATPVAPGALFE